MQPLQEALAAAGLEVWIDYGEIKLGDPIRRKIDDGLVKSRFALIAISEFSLTKYWSSIEWDGLMALEAATGEKRILPVVHRMTPKELAMRSPLLAGRAVDSSGDIDRLVARVLEVVGGSAGPGPATQASALYGVPDRRLFVGRAADLDAVAASLERDDTSIAASVSGLAGIGKTALATELAHRLAREGCVPWRHRVAECREPESRR